MAKNIILGDKLTSKNFVSIGSKTYAKGMVTEKVREIEIEKIEENKVEVEVKIEEDKVSLKDAIQKFSKAYPIFAPVSSESKEIVIVHKDGQAGKDRFECGLCGRKDFLTSGGAKIHLKICKRR